MATTFSDFSDYLAYRPSGGDLLLARNRGTIFQYQGSEILYAISETYLVGFQWDQVFSFVNHTDGDVKKTFYRECGLVTTSGSEVSTEFGLSAAFKGIGINIGTSRKNFQSTEVSEVTSVQTEITALANKSTYYYQRRYQFRTRVWYLLDAWSELSRVGGLPINGQPNYTVTFSESRHDIKSEDYFLTHNAPTGTGVFDGSPATPPTTVPFKWTRQFNNTTSRTQNYLRGLANRGMAYISGYNVARSSLEPRENEGEGAEYIGVEHPLDKSQDEVKVTSKHSSDAPADENLPAAVCDGGLAALDYKFH